MKIKNERDFQKWLRDTLKRCDCEVLNVHGHSMQASGWPDLYFVHGMISGWLELKFKDGKLTALQEHRLERLRSKGVMAVTFRCSSSGMLSIDEMPELLSHYKEVTPKILIQWLADQWQLLRIIEITRKAQDE